MWIDNKLVQIKVYWCQPTQTGNSCTSYCWSSLIWSRSTSIQLNKLLKYQRISSFRPWFFAKSLKFWHVWYVLLCTFCQLWLTLTVGFFSFFTQKVKQTKCGDLIFTSLSKSLVLKSAQSIGTVQIGAAMLSVDTWKKRWNFRASKIKKG